MITSIDWGMTPEHRPAYNIDWSLTQFCNLDCSYCTAHDNTTSHPPLNDCIKSLDFALEYADLVMSIKKKYERNVTLNLLGGEVLIHPEIIDILKYCHSLYQEKYQQSWYLGINLLTNAAIGKRTLKKCIPFIKHWTVSYHTETNKKQKKLIVDNIFELHASKKLSRVRVLMHSSPEKFKECLELIEVLKENNIPYEVTPIGLCQTNKTKFDKTVHEYSQVQSQTILTYWNRTDTPVEKIKTSEEKFVVTKTGHPCCSGQLLCINQDRRNLTRHIPAVHFKDWYCSVNLSFLAINQVSRLVHHNSSCRVNSESKMGPIGTLSDTNAITNKLREHIQNKTVPIIKCPTDICGCGRCAPKADNIETFKKIMAVHVDDVLNFPTRETKD